MSTPRIHLVANASKLYLAYQSCIYCLGISYIAYFGFRAEIPGWLSILTFTLLTLYTAWQCFQQSPAYCNYAIIAATLLPNTTQSWQLYFANGQSCQAILRNNSLLTTQFAILQFTQGFFQPCLIVRRTKKNQAMFSALGRWWFRGQKIEPN